MKCAACHSQMVKRRGKIDLRIQGKLYLVRSVAFEECPACGEKVICPQVDRDLFERIANQKFLEKTIKVPVLEGSYGWEGNTKT